MITQVVGGAGENGKSGRWVREWGADMDRMGVGPIWRKKELSK